jgi:hypothetical protein
MFGQCNGNRSKAVAEDPGVKLALLCCLPVYAAEGFDSNPESQRFYGARRAQCQTQYVGIDPVFGSLLAQASLTSLAFHFVAS